MNESDDDFWIGWESGKDIPQEVGTILPHYVVGETIKNWFKQDGKFHLLSITTDLESTKFLLDGVEAEVVQKKSI